MNAQKIIATLGGDWHGSYGLAPGPGHSHRDRSVSVTDGPHGEIIVHSFAGEPWQAIKDAWKAAGYIDDKYCRTKCPTTPRLQSRQNDRIDHSRQNDAKHPYALEIWNGARPIKGTLGEAYFQSRGITCDLPASLRFTPACYYRPSNIHLPAVIAAVQGADRRVKAIQRIYLDPTGRRKAQVSQPVSSLASIKGGAVRLDHAGETLALAEGVEDGLSLLQMTGCPVWAVLGTSNFKNFIPPEGVKTIILAPDADQAGDAVIADAASRFSEMGLKVRHLRPRSGDWNDALLDFEERAAIREFDGGGDRQSATLEAFAEVVGGRIQ